MTPSCREIRGFLDDWLDDVLAGEERAALEQHLTTCDACRTYFAKFESQANDLLMLAGAANRIAASGKRLPEPSRRRLPVLRLAAAIVIAASVGLYTFRYLDRHRPVATVSREGVDMAPAAPRENSDFQLTLADSRTAVQMKSEDPQIHIVWLYEDPLAPVAPGDEESQDLES